MKITSISIHDVFDENNKVLNAKFNDDITFLFGKNGCGKTTLLNILSIVISGELYKIINYQFSRIILKFIDDSMCEKELLIYKNIDNERNIFIKITLDNVEEIVNIIDERNVFIHQELYRSFFENHRLCNTIKETFNYIYLPLNRYDLVDDNTFEEDRYIRYKSGHYYKRESSMYLKNSMQHVKDIIKNYIMDMNVNINKVDDQFRQSVLKEMSTLDYETNTIDRVINEYKKLGKNKIDDTRDVYVEALKINGIYDNEKKDEIEKFISAFNDKLDFAKSNDKGLNVNFAWLYFQYLKMEKIAEYSETHDKEKASILKQKDSFVETINRYLNDKTIEITDNGELIIHKNDKNSNIDILKLSSGEKQLLITFVTLYFDPNINKSSGIFILDEPELSLHIEWQRNLVSDLFNANNNIQYIYATHSPEIIAKFKDKMYEIV